MVHAVRGHEQDPAVTRVVVAVFRDPGRHLPRLVALADAGLDEQAVRIGRTEPHDLPRRRDQRFAGVGTDAGTRLHQAVFLREADVAGHQGPADERHAAQRAVALFVGLVVPVHRAEPDGVGVVGGGGVLGRLGGGRREAAGQRQYQSKRDQQALADAHGGEISSPWRNPRGPVATATQSRPTTGDGQERRPIAV